MEWKDYIHLKGQYFGYPNCCITAFANDLTNNKHISSIRKIAGSHTGFIPCHNHAIQILTQKISINNLITNRQCKLSFPKNTTIPYLRIVN